MNQQQTERRLLRIAVVLFAIAIITIAYAHARVEVSSVQILFLVLSSVPILLGAFLVYLVILSRRARSGKYNYFLYDRKLKGNMPPEQLTFSHVSERVMNYMALFRKGRQLYVYGLFEENNGAPEVFKPLFCYQLLGMMSVCTEQAQWDAFFEVSHEMADIFSKYLLCANDEELSRDIQHYMTQPTPDPEAFRSYLASKSEYLQERMLSYTKAHLHEFD